MEVEIREDSNFDPESYKRDYKMKSSAQEIIDLDDPRWENLSEAQRMKLEEIKSKVAKRSATYDEILALVEAEVRGLDDLDKEKDMSSGTDDDSLRKKKPIYHDIEEVHEKRYGLNKPALQVISPADTVSSSGPLVDISTLTTIASRISARQVETSARSRKPLPPEPHVHLEATPLSSRVVNQYHSVPIRPAVKSQPITPTVVLPPPPEPLDFVEIDDTPTLQHKVRQKRRTLEEVILYDVDTFYEKQKPKSRDSSVSSRAARDKREVAELNAENAQQTEELDQSSTAATKKKKRKKRNGRRTNAKEVTYIVTTDQSLSNRRLSNKDWSLFLAKQKSDPVIVFETSDSPQCEQKVDAVVNESSPSQSGCNDDTLPIRGKHVELISDATTEPSAEIMPKVKDSVKHKRKRRGPKKMTYVVTYDSLPSGKGSPLPIHSNVKIRPKIEIVKQDEEMQISETSPKGIYEIEKMISSNADEVVVDSNANSKIPDFYMNSDLDAVNSTESDTKVIAEIKYSTPVSTELSTSIARSRNIYTPPPEQHLRQASVTQPSPDTVKYLLLFEESADPGKMKVEATSEDYENWSDAPVYGEPKSTIKEDMVFTIDHSSLVDFDQERERKREYAEAQEAANIETYEIHTDVETDFDGRLTLKETNIDEEIERMQREISARADYVIEPESVDVTNETVAIETSMDLDIIADNQPVIVETIQPILSPVPKPKAVTYIVQYKENRIVKPMGKYRRKQKSVKQVKVAVLPQSNETVVSESMLETSQVAPTISTQPELPSLQHIKGKGRKLPKEVTYIVNHNNPFVDIPVGKFSRSKRVKNIPVEAPTTQEYLYTSTVEIEESMHGSASATRSSAQSDSVKGKRAKSKREPEVVTYVTNYESRFIDWPSGKFARSKRLPPKPKSSPRESQRNKQEVQHSTPPMGESLPLGKKGRRRVPKVATFVVNYDTPYIDRPTGKYRRPNKIFRPSKIVTQPSSLTASDKFQDRTQEFVIANVAEPLMEPVNIGTNSSLRKKSPKTVQYIIQHDTPYIDRPRGPYGRLVAKCEPTRKQTHTEVQAAYPVHSKLRSSVVHVDSELPTGQNGKGQPQIVEYIVQYSDPYAVKPVGKYRRKMARGKQREPMSQRGQVEAKYVHSEESAVWGDGPRLTGDDDAVDAVRGSPNDSRMKIKGGRVRERKSRKVPISMTYIVTYDRQIKRDMPEEDEYTGVKIRNWNLRHKNTEMNLPETVSPRAEIRAQDVQRSQPRGTKSQFKQAEPVNQELRYEVNVNTKSSDDSSYERSLSYEVERPSYGAMLEYDAPVSEYNINEQYRGRKAYDPAASRAPRTSPTVDESMLISSASAETPTTTVFTTEIQPSTIQSEIKVASSDSENLPAKHAKRKFSDARSSPPQTSKFAHNVTYVVSHDTPSRYTNWDIKARKPRRATKKDISRSKYSESAEDEIDMPDVGRRRFGRLTQASYTLNERSTEASVVIPESSSLEFPVAMPQDSKKLSGSTPYVMTYQVNCDLPTKRKEWDIQMKKKRSSAVKQKPGRKNKVHQAMTYQVSHDLPRKYKDWDLKLNRGSYSLRKHKVIDHTEEPEIRHIQFVSEKHSPQVVRSTLEASAIEVERAPLRTVDESRPVYRGEVDMEPTELELPSRISSVKMPTGAQLVYHRDIQDNRGNIKEREQNTGHQVRVGRDYLQGRASEPIDIRPVVRNYRPEIEPAVDNNYESLYDSDIDNVPYTEPRDLRVHIDSDYNWHVTDIRRSYRSETPRIDRSNYTSDEYESAHDATIDTARTPDVEIRPPVVSVSERIDYSIRTSDATWVIEQPSITTTRSVDVSPVLLSQSTSPSTIPTVETLVSTDISVTDPYELEPTPQSITYTVHYSEPTPRKEWDIKARKGRAKTSAVKAKPGVKPKTDGVKSKSEKSPETVTYHVTYDVKPNKPSAKVPSSEIDADLQLNESSSYRSVTADSPKVNVTTLNSDETITYQVKKDEPKNEWDIGIRTPPPEFQDKRLQMDYPTESESARYDISPLPSADVMQPQSVTYHITYELPKPRKEWDIKVKSRPKSTPKSKPIGSDADDTETEMITTSSDTTTKPISTPVSVTYEINYGLPQKRKEWDIKAKKSKPKASYAVHPASTSPSALGIGSAADEFEEEMPNLKTKKATEAVIYEVNYNTPRVYKQWDISARKPASRGKKYLAEVPERDYPSESVEAANSNQPSVTYVVDYEVATLQANLEKRKNKSKSGKGKKSKDTKTPEATVESTEPDVAQTGDAEVEAPTLMISLRKPDVDATKAVTMTYLVNHDKPAVWKEWDIKVKKPEIKPRRKVDGTDLGSKSKSRTDDSSAHLAPAVVKTTPRQDVKILIEQPTPVACDEGQFYESHHTIPPPVIVKTRAVGASDEEISDQPAVNVKYDVEFEQLSASGSDRGPTYNSDVEVTTAKAKNLEPSVDETNLKVVADINSPTAEPRGQPSYLETDLDDIIVSRNTVEKPKSGGKVKKQEVKVSTGETNIVQSYEEDISVSVDTSDVKVKIEESEVTSASVDVAVDGEDTTEIQPNLHTVTYKINYDTPMPHKEWDFKMRRSAPAAQKVKKGKVAGVDLDAEDTGNDADAKAKKTAIVFPHTVTYKVNYNSPDLGKESSGSQENVTGMEQPAANKSTEVAQPLKEATEPQSVTFLVKYDLPISKSAKPGKRVSSEPQVHPPTDNESEAVDPSDVNVSVEQSQPGEITVTENVDSKKGRRKSPKKQPQTMTFIVKYEMPLAQLVPPKKDIDAEDVPEGSDINIVPMSEFSTDDVVPESINVEIPAVEVIKAGRRESGDKLKETVTYVVNYQLPKVVSKKEKELKLRIETPQPEAGDASETPKIKDSDDVNLALQGPGTYFSVTQPSPEVVMVAPALGKTPSKQKLDSEVQQVTYTVTYDVIKKKKPSKKIEKEQQAKEIKESPQIKIDEVIEVTTDQTLLSDSEPAAVSVNVSNILPPNETEAQVDVVEVIRLEDKREKVTDIRVDLETESPQYGRVENIERNVYVGTAVSDFIVEAPEMFTDIKHVEDRITPPVEELQTSLPTPESVEVMIVPDVEAASPIVVKSVELHNPSVACAELSYLEGRKSPADVSVVPLVPATGELTVDDSVTIDDRKDLAILLPDITTSIIERESTTCVVDNTTPAAVKFSAADLPPVEPPTQQPVQNGIDDDEQPSVGVRVSDMSNIAVVEPTGPEEKTVEVLKILVPLMQTGTLYRSSSPPPPTKVTYIVRHKSPSPNRSSLSPPPQETQPSSQSEEDLPFSCFGRQSFRKPIKFTETVSKSGNKPVLAVPPSVRSKSENRCILVRLAGDESIAEPPPAFEDNKPSARHFVVVAIDFGTTYSGYAFRFTRDSGESVHIMRQWEGGDPGALDFKTPSTLLLTPEGKFHSFGFTARNFFHDLNPEDAKRWMYFEKFKMALHSNANLNVDTEVTASSGHRCSALLIFSLALKFFKDHALQELSEQASTPLVNDDIQWILTVPAIWKSPAKQFMRRAAYQAGIASPENPTQLMISLEPEAASISVRREKFQELIPDTPHRLAYMRARRSLTPGRRSQTPGRRSQTPGRRSQTPDRSRRHSEPRTVGGVRHDLSRLDQISGVGWSNGCLQVPGEGSPIYADITVGQEVNVAGTRYMIVDCGGGTVDITVHEIQANDGTLIEIHRATGGPHGAVGVDHEFEMLLVEIFGEDFIDQFKLRRPAGWVDLMMAFESRKRATDPTRPKPLNVSLPFSFTDYHKKTRNCTVDVMINKMAEKGVSWSQQGMLRLTHEAMERLFQPTLSKIIATIDDVVSSPRVTGIGYMFLVGGFAESHMLQMVVRKAFSHRLKILIPYDVSLAILKGAVSYGCDPSVVTLRKSRLTYGVSVQSPFIKGQHPKSKLITRDGVDWCTDVFDTLVLTDQAVSVGETVTRHYNLIDPTLAGSDQTTPCTASIPSEIAIYASEGRRVQFTTDSGVKQCGTLCLELPPGSLGVTTGGQQQQEEGGSERKKGEGRDIQLAMTFGNTEITVAAIDTSTGRCIRAAIDFLNK